MTVVLTPDDKAWLDSQIASGRFPTIDDAVAAAIAALKASEATSGLDWVRPLIEESRKAIADGRGVPLDEALAHWDRTRRAPKPGTEAYHLTEAERAAVEEGLEQAKRGEFVSDAEMEAFWNRNKT